MITTTPLTSNYGVKIAARSGENLRNLPVNEVVGLYKKHGVILFRSFDLSGHNFVEFTDQFSTDYVVNGNLTRESVSEDGKTQTVNSGCHMIPVHSEMAYSPFRPDILWFSCHTPPQKHGETMLCDGVEVWSRLSQQHKDLFLNNKIRYTFRRVPIKLVCLFVGQCVGVSELEAAVKQMPGISYHVNEDETLDVEYVVSAVGKPKHHDALAFANSVIVEADRAAFANGTPINQDLRLGLFEVTSNTAYMHKWQPADLLMIDNSRVMHGRAPFPKDDKRRILVRMGRETFT